MKIISCLLILIFILLPNTMAWSDVLITQESWAKNITLNGSADQAVVISPLAKIDLSANTQKVIVVPEKLDIKDEINEFKMFRNRYVIFGIYLSLALYYNWLTRYR